MHFTVCELCLLVDKNHIGVLEVGAPSLGSQEAWFWVRTERKWCHPGMVCPQDWGWGFPQEWKPREDHSWMKWMSLGHEAGYQCLSLWSTGMMLGGKHRDKWHRAGPHSIRQSRKGAVDDDIPMKLRTLLHFPFLNAPKASEACINPRRGKGLLRMTDTEFLVQSFRLGWEPESVSVTCS